MNDELSLKQLPNNHPSNVRPMTDDELRTAEMEARDRLGLYFAAFVNFPCASNFQLMSQELVSYQTAWMNGRKR